MSGVSSVSVLSGCHIWCALGTDTYDIPLYVTQTTFLFSGPSDAETSAVAGQDLGAEPE